MTKTLEPSDSRRGNRWLMAMWAAAACLLLLPLVAMQFTGEVRWTGLDFAVMGALLFAACGTVHLAIRTHGNLAYRAGAVVAVAGAFALVWINLAVGIIGAEGNPANLLFAGVLAVGGVGALIARCRAAGLANVLLSMAGTQIAIPGIALAAHVPFGAGVWGLTVGFVALWLIAAALFRIAARP